MRCPKCGYISFDHNEVCPKCKKDISAEREKMNFPPYRPAPPSLLGALTGEASESHIGLGIQTAEVDTDEGHRGHISFEDSQAIEAMEEAFQDSQDLEIQLETAPEEGAEDLPQDVDLSDLALEAEETEIPEEISSTDLPLEDSAEDQPITLEDLDFGDFETGPLQAEEATEDEILLEPDLSSPEPADIKEPSVLETPEGEEEVASIDLDEISQDEIKLDFEEGITEQALDETSIDLESLDLDLDLEEPDKK